MPPEPTPAAPDGDSPSEQTEALQAWIDSVYETPNFDELADAGETVPVSPQAPARHSPSTHHHSSDSHSHRRSGRGGSGRGGGSGHWEGHRRRRWPWILGGSAVLLLVLVAVAGVFGVRFLHEADVAKSSLEAAKADITTLTTQFASNKTEDAHRTADDLTARVNTAADVVDGPLWSVASHVPVVGSNVDAVRRVTRAVHVLTKEALPPGLELMSAVDLKHLTVAGGGIDLAPLEAAQASLPKISAAFAQARTEVASVDASTLMPSVSGPIDQVLSLIRDTAPTIDTLQQQMPTLLRLAGADGPQRYLVIFQNNAEIRATGGNPAASTAITVDKGKIEMGSQGSSATFGQEGDGVTAWAKLPKATTDLYRKTFPVNSQDFTMTPDFPTTATLFGNLWKHAMGSSLDGVISIDPVVLSNVLAVTGPVTLPDGEKVTSTNAVKLLLSDAYVRFPQGKQSDAFFAAVAQEVFQKLVSTSWDASKMWEVLVTSADEQRVYLHFTDKKAQALVAQAGLTGAVPTSTAAQTQIGMYLNDSSVGKLEYYLTTGITVQCDPVARTVTEKMTLHNGATDAVTTGYVVGHRNARLGLPNTTMLLDVVTVAPHGASIVSVPKADVPAWSLDGAEKGNVAKSRTIAVPAGNTVSVSSTVKLGAGEPGPLEVRYSPTPNATKVSVDALCADMFGVGSSK